MKRPSDKTWAAKCLVIFTDYCTQLVSAVNWSAGISFVCSCAFFLFSARKGNIRDLSV